MIVELTTSRRTWQQARGGAARDLWPTRTSVVIAIRARDGVIGLGEAAPLPGLSRDSVDDAEHACRQLASRLPLTADSVAAARSLAASIELPAARFAIETSLLAILAQDQRISVAQLLVPTLEPVPGVKPSRAIVIDDPTDPRLPAARCVKVKLGRAPLRDDLARATRIARAAPAARLRFDINRAWQRGDVPNHLHALTDALGPDAARVEYVEEPCVNAHELVVDRLPMQIALDESLVDLPKSAIAIALSSRQVAALVLKPTLLGGFARCLDLAALARTNGAAAIASHALEGSIARAACGELARAIGGSHAHGVDG